MSVLRRLVYAAVAPLALLLATLVGTPATADPSADVYINITPNTVQSGYQIEIRASCGDDVNQAVVRSRAFSEVTLVPHGGQEMTTSVTIASTVTSGEYRIRLRCANGSTATTDLIVLDMARPTRGPDTGGGGLAHDGDRWRDRALPAVVTQEPALVLLGATGAAALTGAGALVWTGRRRRAAGGDRCGDAD